MGYYYDSISILMSDDDATLPYALLIGYKLQRKGTTNWMILDITSYHTIRVVAPHTRQSRPSQLASCSHAHWGSASQAAAAPSRVP